MEDELKYFKVEAEEILENMTKDLLSLEKDTDNFELINNLFRYAHTLKGAASVFNLRVTSSLFHLLEDILSIIRKTKQIYVDDITLLLEAVSISEKILDALKQGKSEKDIESLAIFQKLNEHVKRKENTTGKPTLELKRLSSDDLPSKNSENSKETSENCQCHQTKTVHLKSADIDTSNDQNVCNVNTKLDSVNVRIESRDIDRLTNLSNELLINNARMKDILSDIKQITNTEKFCENEIEKLENSMERGRVFLKEISDIIMTARLIEIGNRKFYFEKIVRELSVKINKPVHFTLTGEDMLIDRDLFENLREPIYHILRNSLIHGIESRDQRKLKSKNEIGSLMLVFEKKGDLLNIQCIDDGRGLDPKKIKKTAKEKNIYTHSIIDEMTDKEALSLIFAQGFSTAENITEFAGRGVGMDIIKSTITNLGGFIQLDSQLDQFTNISITLPGSVNLIDTFMVRVSKYNLLFPLKNIAETRIISHDEIAFEAGSKVIMFNNVPVPLLYLSKLLQIESVTTDSKKLNVIIVKDQQNCAALIIDEFFGKKDSIVKPLEGEIKKVKHLRSSTILENGHPAFVINVANIFEQIKSVSSTVVLNQTSIEQSPVNILVVDDSVTTRTLISNILDENGYIVKSAKTGKEALEYISIHSFQLIITDVEMPEMDGFELSKRIRDIDAYESIPIIILTSLSDDTMKRKGIEVGANAYIVKNNFDKNNFLNTVESLI
jgi:chemotaxis protein histidine kinase CheA/CheY-like chemotaxis protein